MRTFLLLPAFLFLTLVLVAQEAESHSSPGTAASSGHCPVGPKPEHDARPPAKVSAGHLIHKVEPKYPAKLRKAHIEGAVLLCATIGKDGKLHNLFALSGPTELIPYAREAVEQWRYEPYRVDNEPVDVGSEIRLDFKLTR